MRFYCLPLLFALLALTAAHAGDRPNIVYILADDIGEKHDLADARPEIAEKLERLMVESRVDSPDFPLVKKKKKKKKKNAKQ